jgi:hypothetical protein
MASSKTNAALVLSRGPRVRIPRRAGTLREKGAVVVVKHRLHPGATVSDRSRRGTDHGRPPRLREGIPVVVRGPVAWRFVEGDAVSRRPIGWYAIDGRRTGLELSHGNAAISAETTSWIDRQASAPIPRLPIRSTVASSVSPIPDVSIPNVAVSVSAVWIARGTVVRTKREKESSLLSLGWGTRPGCHISTRLAGICCSGREDCGRGDGQRHDCSCVHGSLPFCERLDA